MSNELPGFPSLEELRDYYMNNECVLPLPTICSETNRMIYLKDPTCSCGKIDKSIEIAEKMLSLSLPVKKEFLSWWKTGKILGEIIIEGIDLQKALDGLNRRNGIRSRDLFESFNDIYLDPKKFASPNEFYPEPCNWIFWEAHLDRLEIIAMRES
ncbi:MAG: hypothetical protein AAF959_17945 [Cyanobacteria bacterium P01_D01_bin.56]